MVQRVFPQRQNLFLLFAFLLLVSSGFFGDQSSSFLLGVNAVDNGLGLTPPMGWNSWNRFGCNIDETLIKETVDAALDLGLDKLGYVYYNLDDCWQKRRNATGYIVEDGERFPSSIASLSDYIHSKGVKFGLYSDAGLFTCQRRPGSLNHELRDAKSYKAWKIDYLNMCEWGVQDPATWAPAIGNSWRTTSDIHRGWDSWTKILDANDHWWQYAGPGGWNDPDMLEVDNGKMTYTEERAHFTMWCLIKAPLLLGMDLRNITNQGLDIITNKDVIQWNQDPLGVQGHRVFQEFFVPSNHADGQKTNNTKNDLVEVWAAPLDKDQHAVVLFNRGTTEREITALWDDLNITSSTPMHVYDVWQHKDIGTAVSNFTATVGPHDIVAVQLSPAFDVAVEVL
eukprot:scaffold12720_cov152-Cylindrotheca_fusiformis.AAC.5